MSRPPPYVPTTELGPADAVKAVLKGYQMAFVERTLRGQVFRALVLNVILFVLTVCALIFGAWQLTDWLFHDTAWLFWLTFVALTLGALLVSGVVTALLSSLLAPLVHGPLFAEARRLCGAPKPLRDETPFVHTVVTDLMRILRFIFFSALLLPLNLIPGFGQVAYLAAELALAAHTLGWDLVAYHFDLHGVRYGEQRAFIKRRRATIFAVGLIAAANLTIPVWGILSSSLNVCGAGVLSAFWDTPRLSSRSQPPS